MMMTSVTDKAVSKTVSNSVRKSGADALHEPKPLEDLCSTLGSASPVDGGTVSKDEKVRLDEEVEALLETTGVEEAEREWRFRHKPQLLLRRGPPLPRCGAISPRPLRGGSYRLQRGGCRPLSSSTRWSSPP